MNSKETIKYLIIHGHFYQPPRENPWTERIDRQPSAAPYHDWNERITKECYQPNTRSRRLDGDGRIAKMLNNYEWISFNFGPTLLSWIEEKHPDAYEKIIAADRLSAERLGHGNAIAQGYNHIIMPLANSRDKETQIRWGVHDFIRRFGREPAGIWLPETAANSDTLEILIGFGFDFIVLSPNQAKRVRPPAGKAEWRDVSDGSIQTGFPYRCFLSKGKKRRSTDKYIDIFFYDAKLSVDVSFNHLLRNGDHFAQAIVDAYPRTRGDLVTIATDGEIYGHHEPFADMALAYLADTGAPSRGLEMTNFSAYLENHAPEWEVALKPGTDNEGTAWSCAHGVGRWKEACGCNTGGGPKKNQKWRGPLRNGLDALRDELSAAFASETAPLLDDPWRARNDYITVIENRGPESIERYVTEHAKRPLSPEERSRVLSLLESQRNALLMFTSCGWFFDDISGIETTQILEYAARAIELAGEKNGDALEKALLKELRKAKSNFPNLGRGSDIYRSALDEARFRTRSIVGQYAISRHLLRRDTGSKVFGHTFDQLDAFTRKVGDSAIEARSVSVTSPITMDTSRYHYLLFLENNADFTCLVKRAETESEFLKLKGCLAEAPRTMDQESLLKTTHSFFDERPVTLHDLLPDDREEILESLIARRIDTLVSRFDELYKENRDLLVMLGDTPSAPPYILLVLASTVLTNMLIYEVTRWERSLVPVQLEGIQKVIDEASRYQIPIDMRCAAEAFSDFILEKTRLLERTMDAALVRSLITFRELCDTYGVTLEVHEIQNVIYSILQTKITPLLDNGQLVEQDRNLVRDFLALAQKYNFNVDGLVSTISGR